MSYNISPKNKESLVLISSNAANSIFKLQIDNDLYEVQIHYFQKQSVFKNGVKIAEINDAFAESFEENTSNVLLLVFVTAVLCLKEKNSSYFCCL